MPKTASTTKGQIKQASIDLFREKGYYATSISDIARNCGIQKSSIYYHYATKQDILFDIFKTTMVDLEEYVVKALSAAENFEAKLKEAIKAHIFFHVDRQKEAFIADSELRGLTAENYKAIVRMRDRYDSIFQRIIQDGIEAGDFLVKDLKILSYVIITMCTAVTNYFRPEGRLSKEEIATLYSDFIITAMKREHF
ncbi:MAG: TetR family transcriptional regulator [Deltaproteobacteria bacterium]|nr:TetR family transcriptional regulator [Deltaproteobacteria bacterium]